LTTALALIVLLGTLVLFHEFGHFSAAKLFRIRVDEFAFGFGPKWLRLFKRGDTEYTIHPFPLGGFVKLAGMEPGEEDVTNGFNTKPVWQRIVVYFAGPLMSFVLAALVFFTMGVTVGLPTGKGMTNRVDIVMPDSEAARVGLKSGDLIVSIDGKQLRNGDEMVAIIHNSPGKRLTLVVARDDREFTIRATPQPSRAGRGKVQGLLGFLPATARERLGFTDSFVFGIHTTRTFVGAMVQLMFSREVKDALGGPLAIADATQTSVKRGPSGFLELMGILSLSLGVINLFPIPILDGGAIVLLAAEGIRGRRLSPRTIETAQRIGLTVIAFLFLAIMSMDIWRVATNRLFR
jgi:regulator of sigma E protease